MIVERVRVRAPAGVDVDPEAGWPFDVPAVAQVVRDGLVFSAPVTFLVGENGSGKSTLVEALAESFGLDARGGRAGRKYGNDRPVDVLGRCLQPELSAAGARMHAGGRQRRRGYFLRAETAFGLHEAVTGLPGYWAQDVTAMSHGEGFLTVLDKMFDGPGLYLLDEPEAALSFAACLRLVALFDRLVRQGGQVVCATHSPLLTALPGAQILELGGHGIREAAWRELELVDHWRRYLDSPDAYLRHLLGGDGADGDGTRP